MFRFMRPVKTVLSVSRVPVRVAAQANRGEVHNLQSVRFQKKKFRPMSIATTVLATYVAYNLYAMIVLEPFAAALEEAFPPSSEDQDQEESPRIFIPLPGTTQLHKGLRYGPTDPVYLEYSKFLSNPKNTKRLKSDLIDHVKGVLDQQLQLNPRLGRVVKVNRCWLDAYYPNFGPPTYTRSGIEITDDYISLVREPVDTRTVSTINRLLWPAAAAESVWSFIKVVVSEEAKGIARSLGLHTGENPLSIEEILSKQVKLLSKGSPQAKESPATPKQAEFFPDIQAQKSMVDAPENPSLANKKPAEKEVDAIHDNKVISDLSKRLSLATEAYKLKLRRTWRSRPPADSDLGILLSGLVEVETTQARIVLEVTATWDIKQEKYVSDTLVLNMKSASRLPSLPNQRSGK